MKKAAKKKAYTILGLCVLLIAILLGAFYAWTQTPVFTRGRAVPFEIVAGGSAKSVVAQLKNQNVEINDTLFTILVRATGNGSSLRAGCYELRSGETPARLLEKITKGIFALESVTFIEGWRFSQMRLAIARHPELKHETVGLSDQELLKKLGITESKGEGLFFPDTYLFRKGAADMQIYQAAHNALKTRLSSLWKDRDSKLPYKTAYQALIMASLIEKETGHPDDRDMVAGVFVNRLRLGMKLQTDPTVIYGMGSKYQGKIRKVDLLTDTPYNTYTRFGLPPTPIALPGKESLAAAFYPAKTDALYFVARGDGTSHFSSNLKEHNQAVNKYIR